MKARRPSASGGTWETPVLKTTISLAAAHFYTCSISHRADTPQGTTPAPWGSKVLPGALSHTSQCWCKESTAEPGISKNALLRYDSHCTVSPFTIYTSQTHFTDFSTFVLPLLSTAISEYFHDSKNLPCLCLPCPVPSVAKQPMIAFLLQRFVYSRHWVAMESDSAWTFLPGFFYLTACSSNLCPSFLLHVISVVWLYHLSWQAVRLFPFFNYCD